LSFLTRTLPTLGKSLDKALASDIPFPIPSGFAMQKQGVFPRFLSGFWELIFDRDGRILTPGVEPSETSLDCEVTVNHDWRARTHAVYESTYRQIGAVRAVRQICFLFYKLEGAHTIDSERRVVDDFISTDRSLPEADADLSMSPTTARALESARLLAHYVLSCPTPLDLLDITPGHGPGAVATGERPWEKMKFSRHYECIDEVYPYSDYYFYNYTHLSDHLEDLEGLTTLPHGTAKVVLVPKDSRGPRLISEEPLEFQWIQQGQKDALVGRLEKHRVTAGFVNFTNQEINRELALLSSSSIVSKYVTVDMKEASDRVSCWLVNQIFPEHIRRCLYASRSEGTVLPTGELLRLKKFAPMGSAVCFPVEAFIFWALAVGSLRHILREKDLTALPEVYVYGDDLILYEEDFNVIKPVFNELFLEFNEDKCCTGRFFRESCGMDAFKGECVSPLRIKALLGDKSPAGALAYISYVNSLRSKALHQAADYLQGQVVARRGQVPIINKAEAWPYAFVDERLTNQEVVNGLSSQFKVRYNRAFQRDEVRIPEPRPLTIMRGDPDWGELLRLKRKGSFHDPFGFEAVRLAPCEHNVPRRLKTRWAWVDINSLLAGDPSVSG
jgi:hypothetical protein